MQKLFLLVVLLCWCAFVYGQKQTGVVVTVVNAQQLRQPKASVELLKPDSTLLKIAITDSAGQVEFTNLAPAAYLLRVSLVGYTTTFQEISNSQAAQTVTLAAGNTLLTSVLVSARRPMIEFRPDKTVVNLEGGIAASANTVLETLEKLPGVTVDKQGGISLKGRQGVLVLIDGKPSYLTGADLVNLLGSMHASQLSQVEIIEHPSARYDAAGNAGVIDLKFKKNRQQGFNGSITAMAGQGHYFKYSNSLLLNYHTQKVNLFLNYNRTANGYFSDAYALRTYFKADGSVANLLEQTIFLAGKNIPQNLRTGIDYTLGKNTALSLTLTAVNTNRTTTGDNPAVWMQADRKVDSMLLTTSNSRTRWQNAGATLSISHRLKSGSELSADVDALGYRIRGNQLFENNAVFPLTYSEAYRAQTPTDIHILSAKVDHVQKLQNLRIETGWKTSRITTDNSSDYEYRDGATWKPDLAKSNHFQYQETIHAVYGAAQTSFRKWSLQGGLRLEMTSYEGKQLGNALVKDSAFSRKYKNAFPSLGASYQMDSANVFSLSAGRRIDRPAFQKLNPFITIYNKYSYQQGNPYYRPQYTWNIGLNHAYKNLLMTGLQYSVTTDYFSQLFVTDSNGLVLFTEGNLRRMQNLGASVSLQLAPLNEWSLSLQTFVNRKKLEGIVGRNLTATITQYTLNWNNQFRLHKGWAAELTGTFNSTSQQDIQEVVDPTGSVTIGFSKTVAKEKGRLRFTLNDIFYTTRIQGLTQFSGANEAFKIVSDSRFAVLGFTWRFGKAVKTAKRSEGSAGDEVQRVGSN